MRRIPGRPGVELHTMLGQQPGLRLRQRDPGSRAHVRRQRLLLLAREFARSHPVKAAA
jgi:hypothetical protein